MNNDKVIAVLGRIDALLNKLGRKGANGAMDAEDIVSEIQVKILGFFRKNEAHFNDAPVDELVAQCIVIAKNYSVDLIRSSANRPDTSIYCDRVEDAELIPEKSSFFSTHGVQEQNVIVADVLQAVVVECRKDRKADDLIALLFASVKPSPEVQAYCEEWMSAQTRNYSNVPFEVIGAALGFSGTKVMNLQGKLAKIFHGLGYGLTEIYREEYVKKQNVGFFEAFGTTRSAELGRR